MASRGSKGAAATGTTIRASDMEKLSLEQLRSLKEQSDLEVNLLQDSLTKIRTAAARLENAAAALHDLSVRPRGKKLLVPLTASLYVPGKLDDAEKVLVDVGTGYFIEKTMVEGKDYCERKLSLLKSNHDELTEMTTKKKHMADEAGLLLQAKLRQASASRCDGRYIVPEAVKPYPPPAALSFFFSDTPSGNRRSITPRCLSNAIHHEMLVPKNNFFLPDGEVLVDDNVGEESEFRSESEPEEVALSEPSKNAVYNKEALLEKLDDITWLENVEWIHKLRSKRLMPPDYYAEMVKSDSHMLKVKGKLLVEKKKIEEAEERKKAREAKKLAKEVQAQKTKERAKRKKEDIESVKRWRKQRQQSGFARGIDEELDLPLDEEKGIEKSKKRRTGVAPGDRSGGFKRKGGNDKGRKKREFREAKFGHGGRKGMKTQNTAVSTIDFRGFNKDKFRESKRKKKVARAV
ncbi:Eukaryotic rRNA processing protein EBP2 [Musa troglodytarum]|uniref:Eukaryotic rRNA processing protein EBP2 n=1 Tax=Musa troglodytarum TaxID=320322 RepID=A0A9E7JUN6_9LILI|nr:Eukaryotic rRNA processing protein EBP2 [Musa troglodytarum]